MGNIKSVIDFFNYTWPIRKKKLGLAVFSIPLVLLWLYFIFPKYSANNYKEFLIYSTALLFSWILIFIFWLFHSGRIIKSKQPFTVIFCLKSSDVKATKYLQDSIKILKTELDKLGLLQKIQIKEIGQDIIINKEQALSYREKFDIGLIIWGEIFTGSENEKQVSKFKNIFFTYKIPENLARPSIYELFKNDVNIAIVNRDWNIYEINSLPDTEKISENLSEIILFLSGLIYAQYKDFAEDSGVILESLLKLLEVKTKDENILIADADQPIQQIQMSPGMFRKGRILFLLLNLYKNLGIDFVGNGEYTKGIEYLEKCIKYGGKDIDILSNAALASFYLNKNIDDAHMYTNQINEIEKNHQIYILNHAFFGIYKKNYSSALYFYKEIIKRGKNVDNAIIVGIIAFLDERKAENPKEIAYDFAIGILNKFHCQTKLGDKELQRFVKVAKKKDQYREIVSFIENENLLKKKRRK